MYIAMCYCDWKCCKEQNLDIAICQNSQIASQPNIYVEANNLVQRYISNPITSAIVISGLEPFYTYQQLFDFIKLLRQSTQDDIVIYTGYTEEEIQDKIEQLKQFPNIVIKFGRFVPNQTPHYDEVLGIYLANDNQYAKKVS
jgi:pyruvate-formate lyase-activating enzyme